GVRSSKRLVVARVVAAMPSACVVATSSRPPAASDARFGRPIAEADIAPWDIDIRTSNGKGLPPGRGGVAEGKAVYDAKCLACHGPDAKGGRCTARWSAGSAPSRPKQAGRLREACN